MTASLNPIQVRRLLARTLTVALGGGPAPAQLVDRWAHADATDDAWFAALTWDGIGPSIGWALDALDLREVAPPEVESLAASAFEEARDRFARVREDLARLGVAFADAGIPAVALKGSALVCGAVAAAPGMRWVSDIDVLVPEERAQDAGWTLGTLGFRLGDATAAAVGRFTHESFADAAGRLVEVHWRLGPARWGRAAKAEAWFDRAAPSSLPGVLIPAPADLCWHLLLHDARNHAWSSGSLRAAFDLALVARAPGFVVADVLARLDEDPRAEPLLDALADAAHLSPILAGEIEPSPFPRYLRLARWRDAIGRRRWSTERIADAMAWGATLDRARRFGGWRGVVERAVRSVPEPAARRGLLASAGRALRSVRRTAFVGALAAAHVIALPGSPSDGRRALPAPSPRSRA